VSLAGDGAGASVSGWHEEDAMDRGSPLRGWLFVCVTVLAVLAFAAPALAGGRMPTTDIPLDGTYLLKDLGAPV